MENIEQKTETKAYMRMKLLFLLTRLNLIYKIQIECPFGHVYKTIVLSNGQSRYRTITLQISRVVKNNTILQKACNSTQLRGLPKTFFYKLKQFPSSFLCSLANVTLHPTEI